MVVTAQPSRLLDVDGRRASQWVKVVDTQVTITARWQGVRQVQEQVLIVAIGHRRDVYIRLHAAL